MTITVTAFQRHGFQFSGFQEAGGLGGSGDLPWQVKYELGLQAARRAAEREAKRLEDERKERERFEREAEEAAAEALALVDTVPTVVLLPEPVAAPIVIAPAVVPVLEPELRPTVELALIAEPQTAELMLRARPIVPPDPLLVEFEQFSKLLVMLAEMEEA